MFLLKALGLDGASQHWKDMNEGLRQRQALQDPRTPYFVIDKLMEDPIFAGYFSSFTSEFSPYSRPPDAWGEITDQLFPHIIQTADDFRRIARDDLVGKCFFEAIRYMPQTLRDMEFFSAMQRTETPIQKNSRGTFRPEGFYLGANSYNRDTRIARGDIVYNDGYISAIPLFNFTRVMPVGWEEEFRQRDAQPIEMYHKGH